ncbi:MAG: glycosyltransferase family 4 protein [Chloroflexota bacterium]
MIAYVGITEENGQYLVNDKIGRMVDDLAVHFDHVHFVGSATKKDDQTYYPNGQSILTYGFCANNISVTAVGISDGRTSPLQKLIIWLKRIPTYTKQIRQVNFVYIMMPGFSPFLAHLLCRRFGKPYSLYFGSDWQEVALFLSKWTGISRIFYGPYKWLSSWAEKTAVTHSQFTVVHGSQVLSKFKHLTVPVVETVPMVSIEPKHFYRREDTCQGKVINCLYVGILIPRKGIDYLLEALSLLVSKGYKINLQLVGSGDHDYQEQLHKLIQDRSIGEYVNFVGQIADLPTLLSYYRQADIFVLPSQGEGFPRVIYEAMSQGLPVITTSIGTIAHMLIHQEQALLVDPRSSLALCDGIERLIKESKLRRTLIRAGYQFANERLSQGTSSEQFLALMRKHYTMLDSQQ